MEDLFHFYVPGLASGVQVLPMAEARHAVSALRMGTGDRFTATDGKGFVATCLLEETSKKQSTFRLLDSYQDTGRPFELHLYVAPTKNHDRLEWLAEKLQELGVAGLHVCYSDHSVRKSVNVERLKNVAISGLKQSRSAYLVEISEEKIEEAFQHAHTLEGRNYFCYLGPKAESKKLNQDAISGSAGVIRLFLGPEGDFSEKEIEWMLLNEFNPIQLTSTRLRTETAALAAASTWMCLA